jgi:ketosteroid isomerase-like protein
MPARFHFQELCSSPKPLTIEFGRSAHSGNIHKLEDPMKRFTFLVLAVLFASGLVFGQTKQTAVENAVQEITALENAWNEAAQKYDIAWFERNFADTCILTDEDGVVKDKAAAIAGLKKKESKLESLAFEGFKVQVYGDTAIASGVYVIKKGTHKGKDISGKYPFTDTWVKIGGRWQVVADHNSKLSAK